MVDTVGQKIEPAIKCLHSGFLLLDTYLRCVSECDESFIKGHKEDRQLPTALIGTEGEGCMIEEVQDTPLVGEEWKAKEYQMLRD